MSKRDSTPHCFGIATDSATRPDSICSLPDPQATASPVLSESDSSHSSATRLRQNLSYSQKATRRTKPLQRQESSSSQETGNFHIVNSSNLLISQLSLAEQESSSLYSLPGSENMGVTDDTIPPQLVTLSEKLAFVRALRAQEGNCVLISEGDVDGLMLSLRDADRDTLLTKIATLARRVLELEAKAVTVKNLESESRLLKSQRSMVTIYEPKHQFSIQRMSTTTSLGDGSSGNNSSSLPHNMSLQIPAQRTALQSKRASVDYTATNLRQQKLAAQTLAVEVALRTTMDAEDEEARLLLLRDISIDRVSRFPLFREYPLEVIQRLAGSVFEKTLVSEDFIVKRGDMAAEMFFLLRGSVSIVKDNGEVISTLTNDAFFGEVGVLFSEPRTASVRACADGCTLLVLRKEAMDSVLDDYPFLKTQLQETAKNRSDWLQRLKYINTATTQDFGGEFMADLARVDLKNITLFEEAEPDFLHALALTLTPSTWADQAEIVKKGEDATAMYLVLSGLVEVVSDDGKTVYASIGAGAFFGEVGVLLKTKRTATVRSKGLSTLMQLTRSELDRVSSKYPQIEMKLKQAAEERYALFQKRSAPKDYEFELNQQNLRRVGLFESCDRSILDEIASTMVARVFKAGEYIIRCGQKADEMFFLAAGVADVISEFDELIATSDTGSFFGEVGILHNLPRIASVRARTPCSVFVLTRSYLLPCLQKYPEVMAEVSVQSQLRLQNFLMRNVLA